MFYVYIQYLNSLYSHYSPDNLLKFILYILSRLILRYKAKINSQGQVLLITMFISKLPVKLNTSKTTIDISLSTTNLSICR